MIEYKIDQAIGLKFLRSVEAFTRLSKEPVIYIVTLKDKRRFLIQRTGKCNSKKCDSICCKFIHSNGWGYGNFGKKKEFGSRIDIICNYLTKDGKCKVWNKKEFDAPCRYFPVLDDRAYWDIINVCTFKFNIRAELKLEKKK